MAIDTEDKRRSVVGVFRALTIPPVPDSSISGVDKQHTAGYYRGIAAQSPVVVVAVDRELSVRGRFLKATI
jgi:hypothetical protein